MRFMLGVDEAGRGPLAGPVSVGMVAVPEGFDVAREFPGVADSKKLTEKKREEIYLLLKARAASGEVHFRVEFEDAEAIDGGGITLAVRRAITRGVRALEMRVARLSGEASEIRIQLDGALHAPSQYEQETIINGDESVPLISLASIAAKVERDRLMLKLAKEYPEYGFEAHKGYGTKLHYEMLEKYGPCAIHRRSFLRLATGGE